jgi:hypothetical protein
MESLTSGRRLFRTYPWGKPQLARCFLAGENAEGAKYPPWISPKKRPALKLQTEKNATPPGKYDKETINNKGTIHGH